MVIYENKVKNLGDLVSAFGDEMAILFGDNAPDTLKDFCYTIDVKKVEGVIEEGDTIIIGSERFKILAVGNVAQKNLEELGHLTINFSGEKDVLPGAIVVEMKPCPKIQVGTEIRIEK